MIETENRERMLGEIPCCTKHCIYERRRMCLLCRLVIVTSLFVLLFLVRWFFLYILCVVRGVLRFQLDWIITYQRKYKYFFISNIYIIYVSIYYTSCL
jgi:hypothetical protein